MYLAVENIKNRYRRTVLGPWWLTVQMGVFVTGISIIFGQPASSRTCREFLPYVAVGYIVFSPPRRPDERGSTASSSTARPP